MRKFVISSLAVLGVGLTVPAMAQTNPGGAPSLAPVIEYVGTETVQATPGDAGSPSGEVPICKPQQEDNCINSWEANGTGNRPINYWPGRPASEIDGPLPVDRPDN